MGADSLAENTPNAPEFICPICLPNPKSFGFQWKKASLGVPSPCLRRNFYFVNHVSIKSLVWIFLPYIFLE